jgi:hypothetical protein
MICGVAPNSANGCMEDKLQKMIIVDHSTINLERCRRFSKLIAFIFFTFEDCEHDTEVNDREE